MLARRLGIAVALLSAACAQEIVVGGDAAVRDASLDGREPIDGGDLADAGARDGGEGRDAGVGDPRDAGASGPLTWGQMVLPPTSAIQAIWGRSADEVYAGNGNGAVLEYRAASGWAVAWQEPSNHGIRAIGGTPNRLFVASQSRLHVFAGGFDAPTSYLVPQVRGIEDMVVVAEDEVYLVATLTNGRALFAFDGAQVTSVFAPTDVGTLQSIAAPPGQPILVGANGHIFRYERGVVSEERIEWPAGWTPNDIALFTFYDIATVDGRVFAAGDSRIFERFLDGVWRVAATPSSPSPVYGLAGAGARGFAVGRAEGASGGSILGFDEDWSDVTGPDLTLRAVWAAGPDLFYAGGWTDLDGVILRGAP